MPVSGSLSLALTGRTLPAGDRRVLGAFATYAGVALEQQRLAAEAEAAKPIAAADRMRTALLAAVSHDLRTPLASAKAAVTSLRSPDIPWTPEDTAELLATADESLDRLTHLVENLLDMSRLQAGALSLFPRPTGLDEVVARALDAIGPAGRAFRVDVPDALPAVSADPAILERIVVNLAENALRYSPAGHAAAAGGQLARRPGRACGWSTAVLAYPRRTRSGCSCHSSGSATPTTPPASGWAWPCRAGWPRPWAAP